MDVNHAGCDLHWYCYCQFVQLVAFGNKVTHMKKPKKLLHCTYQRPFWAFQVMTMQLRHSDENVQS